MTQYKLFFMVLIVCEIIAIKIFGIFALPIVAGINLLLALAFKLTNYKHTDAFYNAAIEFLLLPLYGIKYIKNSENLNAIGICVACIAMPFLIPPPVDYVICYVVIAVCMYIYNTTSPGNQSNPNNPNQAIALASLSLIFLTAMNWVSVWALFLPSAALYLAKILCNAPDMSAGSSTVPTQSSSFLPYSFNNLVAPLVRQAKSILTPSPPSNTNA